MSQAPPTRPAPTINREPMHFVPPSQPQESHIGRPGGIGGGIGLGGFGGGLSSGLGGMSAVHSMDANFRPTSSSAFGSNTSAFNTTRPLESIREERFQTMQSAQSEEDRFQTVREDRQWKEHMSRMYDRPNSLRSEDLPRVELPSDDVPMASPPPKIVGAEQKEAPNTEMKGLWQQAVKNYKQDPNPMNQAALELLKDEYDLPQPTPPQQRHVSHTGFLNTVGNIATKIGLTPPFLRKLVGSREQQLLQETNQQLRQDPFGQQTTSVPTIPQPTSFDIPFGTRRQSTARRQSVLQPPQQQHLLQQQQPMSVSEAPTRESTGWFQNPFASKPKVATTPPQQQQASSWNPFASRPKVASTPPEQSGAFDPFQSRSKMMSTPPEQQQAAFDPFAARPMMKNSPPQQAGGFDPFASRPKMKTSPPRRADAFNISFGNDEPQMEKPASTFGARPMLPSQRRALAKGKAKAKAKAFGAARPNLLEQRRAAAKHAAAKPKPKAKVKAAAKRVPLGMQKRLPAFGGAQEEENFVVEKKPQPAENFVVGHQPQQQQQSLFGGQGFGNQLFGGQSQHQHQENFVVEKPKRTLQAQHTFGPDNGGMDGNQNFVVEKKRRQSVGGMFSGGLFGGGMSTIAEEQENALDTSWSSLPRRSFGNVRRSIGNAVSSLFGSTPAPGKQNPHDEKPVGGGGAAAFFAALDSGAIPGAFADGAPPQGRSLFQESPLVQVDGGRKSNVSMSDAQHRPSFPQESPLAALPMQRAPAATRTHSHEDMPVGGGNAQAFFDALKEEDSFGSLGEMPSFGAKRGSASLGGITTRRGAVTRRAATGTPAHFAKRPAKQFNIPFDPLPEDKENVFGNENKQLSRQISMQPPQIGSKRGSFANPFQSPMKRRRITYDKVMTPDANIQQIIESYENASVKDTLRAVYTCYHRTEHTNFRI